MRCTKCHTEFEGNFCPNCGTRVVQNAKKQGVLLGFRSNKAWKKVLSVLYIIFFGIVALAGMSGGREGQVTVYDFVIDKIWSFILILTFFSPYIFLSNTKLRDVLPLFNKRKAGLSFVGMIVVVFLLAFIGGGVNSMHSEEYQADMENHAYVVISTEGVSCTTEGVASLKCEYCGRTAEEIVPVSGHKLVEQSCVEPDCITAGSKTSKCENCGEIVTEPIAALGHTLTEVSRTDATCTTTGSVTSKCDVCEAEIDEEIAMLPHDLVEASRKDATCAEAGELVSKCNVCGEKVTEALAQLTHKLVEVSRQDATDFVDGEIVSRCENCGEESVEIIPCLIARGSKENPYVIEPQVLFDLSVDGESQKPYYEQWVNITGTVLSISDYGDLKGYYLIGGPGNGVVCWVDGDDTDVQYGQAVNFIGKVSVADTKHIEINECEIVSVSWPEEKQQSPVTISGWRYTIDYVGGVEWNFKLTNNSDKTIKYVVMEWYCYNGVGDLIRCEITGKSSHSVRYTGPLEPGQTTNTQRNTTLFYNHSYKSAKLTKLQVEFMDGTIINITSQGYSDIIVD